MDEQEFKRAYTNLRVLIDHVGEPDEQISKTHIRNAMLTIAAMLDGLNQRITEMQASMQGEEEDE